MLPLLTLAMQSTIYAPVAIWPLAYVCFVPWLITIAASTRPRTVYIAAYLLGAAFFLINLRWLWWATGAGYVAGSLHSGIWYLVVAWGVRHLSRRRRIPLVVAFPVLWVMAELARSRTALSFPWFLLGHSHYRVLTMIQISDLGGAFAVSFVLAVANGAIADGWLAWLRRRRSPSSPVRPALLGGGVAAALLMATAAYGRFRLAQSAFEPGPRIAVLQGDYVLSPEQENDDPWAKRARYMELLSQASASDPDLYLFPETPWTMYLNREFRALAPEVRGPYMTLATQTHEMLCATAQAENAYIVIGSMSVQRTDKVYPREERFNSAFFYRPYPPGDPCPEPERYDKIHLVLFGEYVPFRYRYQSLYRWLNSLTPWGAGGYEYSLTEGREYKVFEMNAPSLGGRTCRFAVPICYEDVIPHVIRRFVTGPDGRKRADMLLNISNDGWFWHSTELPQHLAACAFRAVENRVAIARAVNTGISGFVDPDGRIRDLVSEPGKRPWAGITGYRVSRLKLDARHTLYSRRGDWLAGGLAVAGLLGLLDALGRRIRENWFRGRREGTS